MLVLVVRMYIFTEREKEANPIRTRSRASLLTDIYCAQKCVRAAINLRIHTEFLIYIFSAECFSLFLSFSLILFLSLLLPPRLSSRPLFSLLHPFLPIYARCIVFLWRSPWIFCFSCLDDTGTNRVILPQTKDSLVNWWNVAKIRTNKWDKAGCSLERSWSDREIKNGLFRGCDSTFFLFVITNLTFIEIATLFDHQK